MLTTDLHAFLKSVPWLACRNLWLKTKPSLKLSCHFLFTHADNAWIFRTIDIYLQAVWANPRFISSNQGKNATLQIAFSIGKFLFKLKTHVTKKL
jgi:hypothetical protein